MENCELLVAWTAMIGSLLYMHTDAFARTANSPLE